MYQAYVVHSATNLTELRHLVDAFVDRGYVPLGGIAVIKKTRRKRHYYQAMIKRSVLEHSNSFGFIVM